jgi:hypothetical protein
MARDHLAARHHEMVALRDNQQTVITGAPTMAKFSLHRVAVILASAIAVFSLAPSATRSQEQPQLPQVSDEHKLLHKDVGTWDATMKIFPQEGAEPLESKGTEKNELLPGGMWLLSDFNGEILGMPFSGRGTAGYDPIEKKYIGTWVDSISPHLTIMKGDYDAATKTMTSIAEGRDFETGQITKSKHITRFVDENTRTFEIHATEEGGKERKVMEIQYKRRAG